MESGKNKRSVILGIFILVGLILFVAGILALGGQQKTFASTFAVRTHFDDVNGLMPGSNVWLSGVKVGTVKDMALSEGGKVRVVMAIEEKNRKFIPHDVRAKIGSDGLIGNRIVVIEGGTPGATPISNGAQIQSQKDMGMQELMASLQSSSENLKDITSDFRQVSSGLASGQGSLGRLLRDETLILELESALTALKRASLNAQDVTRNVSDYTAKLQTEGSLTNDLVTDTTLFSGLRATVAQLEATSRKANELVAGLQTTMSNLDDTSNTVGLLLHDKETAASLETTIRNLQEGTHKLNENMEALQHNFLLRGFFRKKAKREAAAQ